MYWNTIVNLQSNRRLIVSQSDHFHSEKGQLGIQKSLTESNKLLVTLTGITCTQHCSLQVKDPSFGYLVNRSNVRILVEWLQSSVLFQSTYHNYDDVSRDGRAGQLAIKLFYH